jgi:hypothetical protein
LRRNESIYGKLRGVHPNIYKERIDDKAHDTTVIVW